MVAILAVVVVLGWLIVGYTAVVRSLEAGLF